MLNSHALNRFTLLLKPSKRLLLISRLGLSTNLGSASQSIARRRRGPVPTLLERREGARESCSR